MNFTLHSLSLLFLFFVYLCNPLTIQAQTIPDLLQLAQDKNLAKSKQWLGLLHYNQGGTLHSRNQSYIKDSDFFLSNNGHLNSKAELNESIRLLFSENSPERCRFPARYRWLSEQLNIEGYQIGLQHCGEFLKIQKEVAAESLTLIFPSAYLNSASSFFGHTLLRIDSQANSDAVVLNWAINYGAKFDPQDGMLEYATKGIFGQYPGQYFVVPYAQKIKEYGQIENRDIWEYPLALTQEEVSFITEHLWELQNIDFDYYFFDENCSYRLLELIEIARPQLELSQHFRLTEIPINTVKLLHEQELINESILRPSKERLLIESFDNLKKNEQELVRKLSKDLESHRTKLDSLEPEKQFEILHVSYQNLRFQQSQAQRDKNMAKNSLRLLSSINELSRQGYKVKKASSSRDEEFLSILNTHDSQRVSVGFEKNKDGGHSKLLQYRMTYHGMIDNPLGFAQGAHVEGPSFLIKQNEDGTLVDEIELLDIISLDPISPARRGLSWTLSAKASRSDELNTHLHSYLQGGGGYTLNIADVYVFALFNPRIEAAPRYEKNLKGGLQSNLGFTYRLGRHPGLFSAQAIKLDSEKEKYLIDWGQQWTLSKNHGLGGNIDYVKQGELERTRGSLSYHLYF